MAIRVLAVSDEVDPRIYSASLRQRMPDVQLVFGCGDVPASYLEFLADALNRPVYYVLGNHLKELTRRGDRGCQTQPMGCVNLGGHVCRDDASGMILAGLPGSPRYADGEETQYTEWQMFRMIAKMIPRLLWNKLRHGRALDVLITHAPPRDINDRSDVPHRGFKVIRRFLDWFHPAYQLHGHVHLYDRNEPFCAVHGATEIINVYPYRVLDLELEPHRSQVVPEDHAEAAAS